MEIVRAACFGVGTRHLESAEGMSSHHGTRAFAIEIEIAHVKFARSLSELLFRTCIHRACKSIFGVICDAQSIVKIFGGKHHKHRPEDLFLAEWVLRCEAHNDRRLDEVSVLWSGLRLAATDHGPSLCAVANIFQNTTVGDVAG